MGCVRGGGNSPPVRPAGPDPLGPHHHRGGRDGRSPGQRSRRAGRTTGHRGADKRGLRGELSGALRPALYVERLRFWGSRGQYRQRLRHGGDGLFHNDPKAKGRSGLGHFPGERDGGPLETANFDCFSGIIGDMCLGALSAPGWTRPRGAAEMQGILNNAEDTT